MPQDTYTMEEAVKELGISRQTIHSRSNTAQIKPKKVPLGGTKFMVNQYSQEDIDILRAMNDPRQENRKYKKKRASK